MTYLHFSITNLFRKKQRTTLAIVGVSVVVMTFFSLYTFSQGYQNALSKEFASFGVKMLAVPKGCPYEMTALILHGGEMEKTLTMHQFEKISREEGVKAASPLLLKKITLKNGAISSVLYGVLDNFALIKPSWKLSKLPFSENRASECIIGYRLAKMNALSLGDTLSIDQYSKTLTVVSILPLTHTADDQFVFAPLSTVQEMFILPDQITAVAIQFLENANVGEITERISLIPDVQTVSFRQAAYTMNELIQSTRDILQIAMIFTVLIGFIGIMSTVFMGLEERKREFGMMKAMGADTWNIGWILFTETAFLLLIGSVTGIFAAIALNSFLENILRSFIQNSPAGQLALYSVSTIASTVLFTVMIGLFAIIIPLFTLHKISPLEAIRNEK